MSTTTNLKLFKHDNPETNTEQFDVEKSLNENWDKLDANAGEVANRIQTLENRTNEKDTSQDIEIESLKSENTLLKSQIPSATVVGEAVHLEDSSNMQCQIMPLGASKQETREGYNKLPYPYDETTKTINGITFTDNKDGTITANGTATANSSLKLYGTTSEGQKEIPSGYISGGINASAVVRVYNNTNSIYTLLGQSRETESELDLSTYNIGYIEIFVASGTVLTNAVFKPMICETSGKEYEQYGASPSIEFEAPIESVGDNINLFDGELEVGGINNDGAFNDLTERRRTVNYLDVKEINEITMHFYDMTYVGVMGRYLLYDENYSVIDTQQILSLVTTIDTSSASYVKFWILNTSVPLEAKTKIVKGTSTGAYSPYGQGSVEIYNCNKNLFDVSKLSSNSKNGITLTKNDNGTVTLNGTASDDVNFDFYITDIKATTNHKLQLFNLGGSYTNTYVSLYMATDKTWNDFDMLALTTNKITVMSLKEKTYTYARVKVNKGVVCNNLVMGCQVINDIGETPTEYIEHRGQTKALYTQQPFRAIGDVKDRFVKQNGVWYEEHKIARKIFDGTENWLLGTPTYRYYIEINNESEMSNIDITPLSSHFVCTSGTGIEIDYDTIWLQKLSDSSFRINIFNTNYLSDLENFKIWLTELYNAGTPVYVDYVLATPTLIECTPEQVEVLESFNTYKNVTNISSDSIGELEVFYYKDLETLLGGV